MKLTYYVYLYGGKLVGILPIRLMRAIGHGSAILYYYLLPGKRKQVKKNMRRALGEGADRNEIARFARDCIKSYADYWVDVFWIPSLSREYVLSNFFKYGESTFFEARDKSPTGGMIIVLPHFGSWEFGAVFLSSLGPFAAVAEVLKPPELFDLFCKLREKIGIKIFPYDSKPSTRLKMVEALKNGTMLALLCDRDQRRTGVEVEFFGERTTLPPGPAALAMKSGCPIVCVNVRNHKGDKWSARVTEPIYPSDYGKGRESIAEIMQEIAYRLEDLIRDDPSQWHLLMPAWPSDYKDKS